MALTDTKLRSAKPRAKPYKLPDEKGLYLDVRPSGAKIWRYRFWKADGKDGIYTIGEYPAVSLSEARQKREEARKLVKQGVNPTQAKELDRLRQAGESANTLEAVAHEWMAENKQWSEGHRDQVKRVLEADVFPKVGALPIRMVTAAHLLEIVKAVAKRGAPSIAMLIRQWVGQIFRYAMATLRADGDPTTVLRGSVKRGPVRHNPPLSEDDLPTFVARLSDYGGFRTTVIALWLMLYLFLRTIELRKGRWPQIDFDKREWRLPPESMKMGWKMKPGEYHIIPLSRQAIALLKELHTLTGGRDLMFPNMRKPTKPMSATTVNRALEYMGYAGIFSGHGFRSTASTMLHEMGWSEAAIEKQLAHAERNQVKAAYNHAEYLKERRKMMQAWADWIDALPQGKA